MMKIQWIFERVSKDSVCEASSYGLSYLVFANLLIVSNNNAITILPCLFMYAAEATNASWQRGSKVKTEETSRPFELKNPTWELVLYYETGKTSSVIAESEKSF